jgi:hypothetical protein
MNKPNLQIMSQKELHYYFLDHLGAQENNNNYD